MGFVHGVMNTDNMSILGLTIDYGPYGWLENYDPEWTPNTTDALDGGIAIATSRPLPTGISQLVRHCSPSSKTSNRCRHTRPVSCRIRSTVARHVARAGHSQR